MEKIKLLKFVVVSMLALFLMAPAICVGWDDAMEILANVDFSTLRHEWYPAVEYNSKNNEFLVIWNTSGKLPGDCPDGLYDPESDCNSWHSIHAQRVSPAGELKGGPMELVPPELGFKTIAKAVHNPETNDYIVSFSSGEGFRPQHPFIGRISKLGEIEYDFYQLFFSEYNVNHPELVFNSQTQESLYVCNDKYVFDPPEENPYFDNVGYILDGDGGIVRGPFVVGAKPGDQFNPQAAYNSSNDTYLVAWEDFRNGTGWMSPCDIYGAIMDADGNPVVADFAVIDDHDLPPDEAGDQRVQEMAYNPDKDEFLIAWRDTVPTLEDGAGIRGRVFGSDGTPKGGVTVIADGPKNQGTPQVKYVQSKQKYFVVWSDTRNDPSPPGTPSWMLESDVYARWVEPDGQPVGDEIPIFVGPGSQSCYGLAYDPKRDCFLLAWPDSNAPDDYEPPIFQGAMVAEAKRDARGVIYGTPQ